MHIWGALRVNLDFPEAANRQSGGNQVVKPANGGKWHVLKSRTHLRLKCFWDCSGRGKHGGSVDIVLYNLCNFHFSSPLNAGA